MVRRGRFGDGDVGLDLLQRRSAAAPAARSGSANAGCWCGRSRRAARKRRGRRAGWYSARSARAHGRRRSRRRASTGGPATPTPARTGSARPSRCSGTDIALPADTAYGGSRSSSSIGRDDGDLVPHPHQALGEIAHMDLDPARHVPRVRTGQADAHAGILLDIWTALTRRFRAVQRRRLRPAARVRRPLRTCRGRRSRAAAACASPPDGQRWRPANAVGQGLGHGRDVGVRGWAPRCAPPRRRDGVPGVPERRRDQRGAGTQAQAPPDRRASSRGAPKNVTGTPARSEVAVARAGRACRRPEAGRRGPRTAGVPLPKRRAPRTRALPGRRRSRSNISAGSESLRNRRERDAGEHEPGARVIPIPHVRQGENRALACARGRRAGCAPRGCACARRSVPATAPAAGSTRASSGRTSASRRGRAGRDRALGNRPGRGWNAGGGRLCPAGATPGRRRARTARAATRSGSARTSAQPAR